MNKYCLSLLFNLFVYSNAFAENIGVITAEIKGVKEIPKTTLICGIFDSQDGFPKESSKAIQIKDASVDKDIALCSFEVPTDKLYAISVVHDINNNRQLDTNALGIPKEGWASSKNVTHAFRPPSFDESKVLLNEKNLKITLQMHY